MLLYKHPTILGQVKTECESKVIERYTHLEEELSIARNKLNAKSKHLRKVFNQCYAVNKKLYQIKSTM